MASRNSTTSFDRPTVRVQGCEEPDLDLDRAVTSAGWQYRMHGASGGGIEQRAQEPAVHDADRVVGPLIGSAPEQRLAVTHGHERRTARRLVAAEAGRPRSPAGALAPIVPAPRHRLRLGRARRSSCSAGLPTHRGPVRANRVRRAARSSHIPLGRSRFWRRTWPRAISFPSSGRRTSTCQSCCVRRWWMAVATTLSRRLPWGSRKSVILLTLTASCPLSLTASKAPTVAKDSMAVL